MWLFRPLLSILTLTLISTYSALAQELPSANGLKEKHAYQSDVARLRQIVINSLYSHRDVFLRELISNANDALEKLRITALTDKDAWDGVNPLNITIKAIKNEDGHGGRLVISDTGIGMTPEELRNNLGTLAKSGTSEFLSKAESDTLSTASGNLIGQFGLGFYSSFLVADQVYVSSVSTKSDTQYVFSSSANEGSFEIYPDPRGNTLGRGTEITLVLKEDALEYLDDVSLAKLVAKHSGFSSSFPIYQFTQKTEQVPIDDSVVEETATGAEDENSKDNDEAAVEEVTESKDEVIKSPKTKSVVVDKWAHLNPAPPIWQRDPKDVDYHDYRLFYQSTFKDFKDPLAWHHFSGVSDDGVAFKAIIYVPSSLDQSYWNNPLMSVSNDIRLMVKRVFITSDLGEDAMPKWASWVKAIVDAEDLPLNVSRETLQSTKFLKQLKQVILRHLIQLIGRLATDEPEKFDELQKSFGSVLKLGAVEDKKNSNKLALLTRFATNQRNNTSFNEYLENKKEGQKQIFYVADAGKSTEELATSVFVEKLDARGYEVLLLNQPLDEMLIQSLKQWRKIPFQDVAKSGLQFGDEESDPDADNAALAERFKPLLAWMKREAAHVVRDVIISNRLVSSPCAIVADFGGYTANVERLISQQNSEEGNEYLRTLAKKQKLLEVNPHSPLMEGLLRRIEELPSEDEGKDLEAEKELEEIVAILIDGALVRSGYDVTDSNEFYTRVERVLRRSLGVSETAKADTRVKPAPPVDPTLYPEDGEGTDAKGPVFNIPSALKDKFEITAEEITDEPNLVHDEL